MDKAWHYAQPQRPALGSADLIEACKLTRFAAFIPAGLAATWDDVIVLAFS
jgi:hypothetical protein